MRRRTVERLVGWVDAAARRSGLDPVRDAAKVREILWQRSLSRGDWWRLHVSERMARPPRPALQRAARAEYAARAEAGGPRA